MSSVVVGALAFYVVFVMLVFLRISFVCFIVPLYEQWHKESSENNQLHNGTCWVGSLWWWGYFCFGKIDRKCVSEHREHSIPDKRMFLSCIFKKMFSFLICWTVYYDLSYCHPGCCCYSMHCSVFSKPGANITHNATRPQTVHSESGYIMLVAANVALSLKQQGFGKLTSF